MPKQLEFVEDAWEMGSAKEFKDHVTSLGGEFAAFTEGSGGDVLLQVVRRLPYFDQTDETNVKLLYPSNACGVFELETGQVSLGCILMVRFDTKTQTGKLLVQWLYSPFEASSEITKAMDNVTVKSKKSKMQALKRKFDKMNNAEELLLSNQLNVVPTGSCRGPAIEKDGGSKWIRHYLDVDKWEWYELDAKPLRELVRPVKWDNVDKAFGEVMGEEEFVKMYGHHAAHGGLLQDDIHPPVPNPGLILASLGHDEEIEKWRAEKAKANAERNRVELELEAANQELALLESLESEDSEGSEDSDEEMGDDS
ncbi:hypothetical protein FS837_004914 [Tulasnella sp. UAMH 9824]|nr:hypothetical protein FS837_004914 [Tulasnella sp. UAMH 9824]